MNPTPLTGVVDAAAAAPRRRRRGLRTMAVAAAVGAALLTGCQVSNTPTGYDTAEQGTIVQTNFLAACTGDLPADNGTTPTLAPKSRCQCMFEVFVAQVPFNDDDRPNKQGYPADAPTFESLENSLRTDPNAINTLPAPIKAQIDGCGSEQTVGTTPPA